MQAWFSDLLGTKKSRTLMPMFNLDQPTPQEKAAPLLYSNWTSIGYQDADDCKLVWMIHQSPNDRARAGKFNVAWYWNRSCTYCPPPLENRTTFWLWGARAFARPSERNGLESLNYLLWLYWIDKNLLYLINIFRPVNVLHGFIP